MLCVSNMTIMSACEVNALILLPIVNLSLELDLVTSVFLYDVESIAVQTQCDFR